MTMIAVIATTVNTILQRRRKKKEKEMTSLFKFNKGLKCVGESNILSILVFIDESC
jgi:hypothetical protein